MYLDISRASITCFCPVFTNPHSVKSSFKYKYIGFVAAERRAFRRCRHKVFLTRRVRASADISNIPTCQGSRVRFPPRLRTSKRGRLLLSNNENKRSCHSPDGSIKPKVQLEVCSCNTKKMCRKKEK